MFDTQELTLTPQEFRLFRDFLQERTGIYFSDDRAYLIERRLTRRVRELGLKTFEDYFYHVKYDATMAEFSRLVDLITTNETSFFRNLPQLQAFALDVLPRLREAKAGSGGSRSLKIWSAGCSTGEEPYTLALLVLENLPDRERWKVEILASDISEKVLRSGRCGLYSATAMRSVPQEMAAKYFTVDNDRYCVKPEVKDLVRFGHLNLNDRRKLSLYTNMDVIFCRNVMICFSDEAKRHLVRSFYNALRPGGYLFIGHSESLHGITRAFKLVYLDRSLAYMKEGLNALNGEPVRLANYVSGRSSAEHEKERVTSRV
jgi:chemotaxis protein methyltransferase CheR